MNFRDRNYMINEQNESPAGMDGMDALAASFKPACGTPTDRAACVDSTLPTRRLRESIREGGLADWLLLRITHHMAPIRTKALSRTKVSCAVFLSPRVRCDSTQERCRLQPT